MNATFVFPKTVPTCAASVTHGPKDVTEVDKYGKLSKEENSVQATRIFDLESIDLERKYKILQNKEEK